MPKGLDQRTANLVLVLADDPGCGHPGITGRPHAPTPDGSCGDQDNGRISARDAFSALGLYPVCPGDDHCIIDTPLFDQAILKVDDAITFTITAKNNGPQKPYIRAATLNGVPFDKPCLSHKQINGGDKLIFDMTSAPDYKWGSSPARRPRRCHA